MIAQGLRVSTLESSEEGVGFAKAIINGVDTTRPSIYNSIGSGLDWIPPGSLLLLDKDDESYIHGRVYQESRRDYLVEKVRQAQPGTVIRVLTRPLYHPVLAPPQDYFLKLLAKEHISLQECGRRAKPHPADGTQSVLDQMLLTLWDALFLDDCIRWTKQGVTNMTVERTLTMGKYFMMGLEVGKEAVFTGLCAMCANLLYGVGSSGGRDISNCKCGHPIDKHGVAIRTMDNHPDVDAQPPCFLRFSPKLFATEAPHMFEHDSCTNRLRLKNKHYGAPWISQKPGHWLYCVDCYDRYIGKSNKSHVPFRDKASQHSLRATWNQRKRQFEDTQREANIEVENVPAEGPPIDVPDGDAAVVVDAPIFDYGLLNSDEGVDSKPLVEETYGSGVLPVVTNDDTYEGCDFSAGPVPESPFVDRPSLDEYQIRWADKFAQHSLSNEDCFGLNNLCPVPVPQLWQDAPHVPFDELKSPDAQGRLALCRPISGMQQSCLIDGLEKYAHISGDVPSGVLLCLVCVGY